MSYQQQILQKSIRVFSEWTVHTWVMIFLAVSCIFIMSIVVVCIVVSLKRWRDEAVQCALIAERENQQQKRVQASVAEREEQLKLKLALDALWYEGTALKDEIFRSLPQGAIWDLYVKCGFPPSSVPSTTPSPFHVEIMSWLIAFKHVKAMAENRELRQSDLDFSTRWLETVKRNFTWYQRRERWMYDSVQDALLGLRLDHMKLGQTYCLTQLNSAYRHFPGMLHVLETLFDDHSITCDSALECTYALRKQLLLLTAQYERGKL